MIARTLALLLWLFAALTARALDTFEYGPRPPLQVFDPEGFLDAKVIKEISTPLAMRKREGIDVIVVLLKDLQGAPPDHVAAEFAAAWCDTPLHCVVLHVPGRPDSPWIVPQGKLLSALNPELIRRAVGDAQRRTAAETTDAGKVRAAATEAADMLRYWHATALNTSDLLVSHSEKMRMEAEARHFRLKLILFLAAASLAPIAGGLSLLMFLIRRRKPAYFPEPILSPRLGAPRSGGNNAVANLGVPMR